MIKLTIIILLICPAGEILAQTYSQIIFKKDTFYTFPSTVFFASTFTKPASVPDGRWIIFERDSIVRYKFNTYRNMINGYFEEYENGIFSKKGAYYNDSLWTFRFSKYYDNRFKEGYWTYAYHYRDTTGRPVGVETSRTKVENLWFPGGKKKFERRDRLNNWYYPNGVIHCQQIEFYQNEIVLTTQMVYDTLGDLTKIIKTNFNAHDDDTSFVLLPVFPADKKARKKYFAETTEFIDSERRVTFENEKYIKIIWYTWYGDELKRLKQKRKIAN